MLMRLLHLADVHLDADYARFGALAEERARQVLDVFRSLPERAAEARVHAVLLAGDLFDGPNPSPRTLAAVRETLRRFVDLCIPVFMVPGNHDALTLKLSPYRELSRAGRVVVQNGEPQQQRDWPAGDEAGRRLAEKHRVYVLARPRFGDPVTVETEEGPLHVYGVAYDAAECPDPVATFRRTSADGVHVALLHGFVQGVGRWQVSRNALTVGIEALHLLDVDYIALGDQHTPRMPEEFGGHPACYPGSFAATDLKEAGPRGYVLVDVEPGGPPRVELCDAGVRPVAVAEVDVSACSSDADVAGAATDAVPPGAVPVVHLVGEPAFPLDADAVAAELTGRHGHAAVSDDTRYYATSRLDELAVEDTVAGHVVRLGRERIDAAAGGAAGGAAGEVAQQALRVALRALRVS
jgi:DNA repair protein SbcD/Mre11